MARMDKLNQVARDFVERRSHASHSRNSSGAAWNAGNVFYSYREPIAHFLEGDDGKIYIRLCVRRFSVTTSRHQQAIRLAAYQANRPVIETQDRITVKMIYDANKAKEGEMHK